MGKRVFVSYCHRQGNWVRERMVPCLRAGGAEVVIDRERFAAGLPVLGQMDAAQDAADLSLLVLSPAYLASEVCRHEMKRALTRDPGLAAGTVVPVQREACELPEVLRRPNPLSVDLRDDADERQWDLLLGACGADLGLGAPAWLGALGEVRRLLERRQSANLRVQGEAVRWRELLQHLREEHLPDLAVVDLARPATASRRGLVREILRACGAAAGEVPAEPEDLAALEHAFSSRPVTLLALTHFDMALHRDGYGLDLFAALRYLAMDARKLVLLVQSRTPFAELLPRDNLLSRIDIHTVELRGRG